MMVKMKPTETIYPRLRDLSAEGLEGPPPCLPPDFRTRRTVFLPQSGAVVADRFDGATFHRFLAKRFLFGRLGLLVNVGVTAVVISLEIGGRSLAAQIAVDALLIDVERAGCVLGVLVGGVGHIFTVKGVGS